MARRDPIVRLGDPRRVLLIACVTALVLLAWTRDLAVLALWALSLGLISLMLVGPLALWSARRRQRLRAGAADQPFRWTGPERDHEPAHPDVAALEERGYVVEAFGRNVLDEAGVVLRHPDGSVATVVSGRVLGRSRTTLAVVTCLDPGRQWLVTGAGAMTQLTGSCWVDSVPGAPTPDEVVRRHGETREWFRHQGVAIHPVAPGLAVEDVVTRIRVAAEAVEPLVQLAPMGDRRHRPLAAMPGVEDRLQQLRAARPRDGTLRPHPGDGGRSVPPAWDADI